MRRRNTMMFIGKPKAETVSGLKKEVSVSNSSATQSQETDSQKGPSSNDPRYITVTFEKCDSFDIISPIRQRAASFSGDVCSFSTENSVSSSFDRYGFILGDNDPSSSRIEQNDDLKFFSRLTKWKKMTNFTFRRRGDPIDNWELFSTSKRRKLESRILKGIPEEYRFDIYQRILLPKELYISIKCSRDDQSLTDINVILASLKPEPFEIPDCWTVIEQDISRTFPKSRYFSFLNYSPEGSKNASFGDEIDQKIFRTKEMEVLAAVLQAYSLYDVKTGYTQGMAFSAAMFISYYQNAIAYHCFKYFMHNDSGRDMRRLYYSTFEGFTDIKKVWSRLFSLRYPRIYRRLERISVSADLYCPQWFLSSFLAQEWPSFFRVRLFDRLVYAGLRALLSLGLVVISRHKKELMSSESDVVIDILQKPALSKNMEDWDYVLTKWNRLWISEAQYKKLFKDVGVEFFY